MQRTSSELWRPPLVIQIAMSAAFSIALGAGHVAAAQPSAGAAFHAVRCDGAYPGHLQGVCTNNRDTIYWCFTTVLVKTDTEGHVQRQVEVASHHGDLCFDDGKVYVAVNLGQFNRPAGQADSWIYIYDGQSLAEVARHKVSEVVHGAGGIARRGDSFVVVGGLPVGFKENYLYEYNREFTLVKRHVLPGYTLMGIQTATFADDRWWFGCYGAPRRLLAADKALKQAGSWELDCSLGIVGLPDGQLLVARGAREQGNGYTGQLLVALPDDALGLRTVE